MTTSAAHTHGAMPNSVDPITHSLTLSKLPGWGSPWKKPTSSSCVRKASCPAATKRRISSGGKPVSFTPVTQSMTNTLLQFATQLVWERDLEPLCMLVETLHPQSSDLLLAKCLAQSVKSPALHVLHMLTYANLPQSSTCSLSA